MKKNVVQDVIPPRKSIRSIKAPERSRLPEKETPEVLDYTVPREPLLKKPAPVVPVQAPPPPVYKPPAQNYDYQYEGSKKPRNYWVYGSIAILVVVVLFGLSAFFKSAQIKVTPKEEMVVVNESFTAKKDATGNILGFQLVSTSKDLDSTVDAQSEQQVSNKAQGKIIIYNNYSTAPQKLVATTRFETPEGLVFRIITGVTIPGKITQNGKTVAGSIEAVVQADKAGTAYNIGLKDFTVPGFKGDPRFKDIYARSKTEMTGGFVGMQKVVGKEAMVGAEATLENTLKASLAKDISSQIPDNFVLYSQSLTYKFEPATQVTTEASSSKATIRKRGTATGIIIDKGALTRVISGKIMPDVLDNIVKITNLSSLEFVELPFNPSTDSTLNFTLKGNADFVWVFDENKLKSDLLGLSKKDARSIIGTYGSIKEAWIETRPFWNQTIPKDSSKVTLVNTLTK